MEVKHNELKHNTAVLSNGWMINGGGLQEWTTETTSAWTNEWTVVIDQRNEQSAEQDERTMVLDKRNNKVQDQINERWCWTRGMNIGAGSAEWTMVVDWMNKWVQKKQWYHTEY